jgi:hypothetical protein
MKKKPRTSAPFQVSRNEREKSETMSSGFFCCSAGARSGGGNEGIRVWPIYREFSQYHSILANKPR